MKRTAYGLLLAACVPLAAMAQAQAPWPAPQQSVRDRWPDDLPGQGGQGAGAPSETQGRGAPGMGAPGAQRARSRAPAPPPDGTAPKSAAQPARAVTCTGAFGKDSSHLKLATSFGTQNVAFTDIDGPDGSKLKASVLFPKDPKRRLEVLWHNEAARADTSIIAINGQSSWTGPKGLKLGLALAALEKLNGKPFKLNGFDADGASAVTDWQGGALDKLPGGCKAGIRLALDAKAETAARAPVSNPAKSFQSSDPAVRTASPKVIEILVGY